MTSGTTTTTWSLDPVGNITYFHQDVLGNVVALTNHSGALVQQYRYTVWGEPQVFNASNQSRPISEARSPFLFTAREFDMETRRYHYRARAYSPALGRFLQFDPIDFGDGDRNLARYVANNPVNWVDPLGLKALMRCLRCKDNPSGPMKCRFELNGQSGEPFDANLGPNGTSQTPGDPYGTGGPLPPGTYSVQPKPASQGSGYPTGQPSITGPGKAPGRITTPAGTNRGGLRIHGPGESRGCVTAECAANPFGGPSSVENMMNTHGLDLKIEEVCCNDGGPSF